MNSKRRTLLKGTLAGSAIAVAASAGLLNPRQVLAAWPKASFQTQDFAESLKGLFNTDKTTASNDIELKAPDIAENGAVVPVTINSSLKDVEAITILIEGNPTPLAAVFNLGPSAISSVSTRVKVGKTSNIAAVVKAGGALYISRKEVKVTVGGCGG
ncbi:MAG: thiosulfate oxidation carrier protein SoxY [Thiohalomonadaceae bacterium]